MLKKRFKIDQKVYFRVFGNNKSHFEIGTIDRQIGNMIFMVQGPKFIHKRHVNQIRKRYESVVDRDPIEDDTMDVVFDTFDVPIPQSVPELKKHKRKRKFTEPLKN